MAKKAYIGVDGVARKVKKGYVGVSSVARKIKKAYIGIGGVARPCWGGGELTYYGTVTALDIQRYNLAATTVGDYALFGGGYGNFNGTTYFATVDVYDETLTKLNSIELSTNSGRYSLAATTVGNYALFGGGYGNFNGTLMSNQKNIVDAFDTSLTLTTPLGLYNHAQSMGATTVGDYALFGGGYNNDNSALAYVTGYDSSLTRNTSVDAFNQARCHLAATTVGNYALFGGGKYSTINSYVDAYDTSLTRTSPTSLSYATCHLAATTVGNYALFAGGDNDAGLYYATVNAYDTSLTRTIQTDLSVNRGRLAATTVGNYAMFGGGYSNAYREYVDAYDTSLTRTTPTNLSVGRGYFAATAVGNYALFGGGFSGSSSYQNIVDVYTIA